MITSGILRWAGQIGRMEENRSAFKIIKHNPTGDIQEGLGVNGKTIEWTSNNYVLIQGAGLVWLRVEIMESPCECGIEPLGFISHGVSYLSLYVLFLIMSVASTWWSQQIKIDNSHLVNETWHLAARSPILLRAADP